MAQNAAEFYRQLGAQQNADDLARKQTFSDEYRKKQIADYQGFAQHIQGILTSGQVLDKATGNMRPITDEEKVKLQSTASTVNQYIENLYKPQFDPSKGQVSEDPLHKLTDKMHLTKPPQQPTGQAPQTMEQTRQGVETQFGGDAAAAQKRQETGRDIENMVSLAKKHGISDQAIQDMIEKRLGGIGITRPKDKWDLLQGKVGGKDVAWLKNSATGEVQTLAGDPVSPDDLNAFVPTPKGATGKVSQYDQQKAEFAKSLGKDVSQLTWQDEQQFLKQRQPFGDARLAIAQSMLGIARKNLELKESESDFKSYLAIQKQMAPFEKINTASQNADYYVNNPSGPGDVGLVFAYIEATKPTSGFRFTDTERKWIIATRGLIDGIETKIEGGFTGVTLAPEQRRIMSGIIKNAAKQMQNQASEIIGGAATFKPKAAAAAARELGGGQKKKVSLKKAMGLPQNKGKSEDQVKADISAHGYEVAP